MKSADAMIGCIGKVSCHGFRRGSGISGISTESPLTSSAISRIEFRKRNRSNNSIARALRIPLADSISLYASSFSFMLWTSWLFAPCNRLISLVRSSSSFCFFIRDRLADSRLDSILFLFRSSIMSDLGSPPSDPELAGRWLEAISLIIRGSLNWRTGSNYGWLLEVNGDRIIRSNGHTTKTTGIEHRRGEITELKGSSWENVEPVQKHNREGVQQTNSTHGVGVCHRNSVNIGMICKSPMLLTHNIDTINLW